MRTRTRPAWSPTELADLYATPYNHLHWGYGHGIRMDWTAAWARWHTTGLTSVADLSAGDGALLDQLDVPAKIYGDLAPAPGNDHWITGPIEDTIHQVDHVDLLVMTEIVEHLDDPDSVLAAATHIATGLLLTTPIDEPEPSHDQHYWCWDQAGVAVMLEAAGWTPTVQRDLWLPDTLSYQLWICEASR